MFIRLFRLARLNLLAADLSRELFGSNLAVTVHQNDEWFLELVFHDECFNDGMLINTQLSRGYTRAAMFLIGIQVVGEPHTVRL